MPSDLRFPGIRGPEHEYDPAFDRAERWTGRVARGMAVGIPVWLVLLLAIPNVSDLGPLPSLIIASVVAIAITEAVERLVLRPWLARRRGGPGDGGVARAGRVLVVGLIAWTLLIGAFAAAGAGGVVGAVLVPLALAAGVVVLVEVAVERRRMSRAPKG